MNKIFLGAFLGLFLAGIGFYWWQGRAQVEAAAPLPPEIAIEEAAEEDEPKVIELPIADPGNKRGPKPPAATELTKEEKRFFRYDRNRDRSISRAEMLSTRASAFRKLDKDGNNLLTFEEWAHTTVKKFDGADRNRNNELTEREFRTTRPKPRKKKPSCRC
ncbi:MAG: EF-hand domain-containing protein [Marinomonas sp.]